MLYQDPQHLHEPTQVLGAGLDKSSLDLMKNEETVTWWRRPPVPIRVLPINILKGFFFIPKH